MPEINLSKIYIVMIVIITFISLRTLLSNEKRKPKTNYPKQLIEYLCTQFSLQKNSKLLEPGSGRCDFLNEFQKAGFHCVGLDRDVSSINNEYGLQVKKCDITKEIFPYDDNSFDIILKYF